MKRPLRQSSLWLAASLLGSSTLLRGSHAFLVFPRDQSHQRRANLVLYLSQQSPTSPASHNKSSKQRYTQRPAYSNNYSNSNKFRLNKELQQLVRTKGVRAAEQRVDDILALSSQQLQYNVVDAVSFHTLLNAAVDGRHAEQLMAKMMLSNIAPQTYSWNAVLQANPNKAARLRIYDTMTRIHGVLPNTYTYNLMMSAQISNVTHVEYWWNQFNRNDTSTTPDRQTYLHLFKCYSQHGLALKANDLLNTVLKLYETTGDTMYQPTNAWYAMVIHAYAKSQLPDAGIQADEWLSRMTNVTTPDISVYNQVMNAHVAVGNAQRVQELLEFIEHSNMVPDVITYTTAMKACTINPQQAMELLTQMKQYKVQPNMYTYGTLISLWAATHARPGLQQAMNIFLHDLPGPPTSRMYVDLIYGWSRSNLREAGYKSEQLLTELLQDVSPSKRHDVKLTHLYNAVITAWAKSGDNTKAPDRAEALWEAACRRSSSDTGTAVAVINAYARARIPDALFRIEKMCRNMQLLRDTGVETLTPTRALYNAMLNALAKSCQLEAVNKAEEILQDMEQANDGTIRPDIVTYASIVDCHTKCGGPNPDIRADELLALVETKFAATGDQSLTPNCIFYSAVMQAWSKTATKQGADKAEALLRRNERLYNDGNHLYAKPHAIMYNAAIDAIARSAVSPNSGTHAEELLQEMEDLYQNGDLDMKPTRRSLNAVMLAYRNDVNGGQKAEHILRRMEELTQDGVYDVNPDRIAYNCAIGAIAGSDDPTAADRAQALFDRMERMYTNGDWAVKPDGATYSAVIEAWLKRNDEQGTVMANALLDKFFKEEGQRGSDEVWEVINKYSRED